MPAPASKSCFHCGLPVPDGADYAVEIRGRKQPMCCHGCQAVAQAIVDGGLESFYDHRTGPSRRPEDLIPEQLQKFDLYDQQQLQQNFVEVDENNVRSAALILEGITCAACVWLNERHVRALPGVVDFQVNYSTHRARVRWDDTQIHLSDILRAISSIGYIAHPFDASRQEALYKKERKQALRRLAVAGLGAMQVMMLAVALYAMDYDTAVDPQMRDFLRWISLLLATPVVFYAAKGFFVSAWRDIRRRQLGMDVPVALAIGGAYSASIWNTLFQGQDVYFDSVCMFSFFLLSSRFLEMGARHRAGQAAEELIRLLPAVATRLRGNEEEVVSVSELAPGDVLLVRPGETVPIDGHVVDGLSSVDESLLTGESMPRVKQANDELTGGSVNVESPLTMQVDRVGEDTVVSGIIRLLDRAQAEKPDIARVADRVAAWFVSFILLIAAAVAWWWWQHDPQHAFAITLSVLVVTCPCALSLATPVAITAATGALTRQGLLTTRGHALETFAKATHIVFDKTGTLTVGELQLSAVRLLGDVEQAEVLALAAAIESRSEHPVARVFTRAADKPENLVINSVKAIPGRGVEAILNDVNYRLGSIAFVSEVAGELENFQPTEYVTTVALCRENEWLALFELEDKLRHQAADVVSQLQRLGLQVELLSGDAREAVAQVADKLGINEFRFAQSPEDKLQHIRQLQAQGAVVAMIGDGVNDAPVLSGANVSFAMGSGTQLAHASADMVLLSEQLDHLLSGLRMARRTLAIIKQNLSWAVLYNVVAVPLAAAGMVAPWMAALGMSSSSLVVVINALRLRKNS
ncbi:MAG: heavy metal translocating P-type ATPase [Chromatiales bacterium]|jgi:Cu2+-exporting ATPase